jgi:hypothetical protein
MASVAKWLRQWIVVPPLAGSSPVVRPGDKLLLSVGSSNARKENKLIFALLLLTAY